ncbi:DUF5621 domain-containing protein [Trinickia acidisoli]|uniref:DUF5621 domain-containing protein n=1 Tax=Trinickia acidisoli TaxID=2767482 RepID=UPI001A9080C3|nr:DUF5621 domain-containing protein [Trinickia acidisoli]
MPAFASPVFTVFNHGTCASRDGTGEIVAEFGRLAAGTEYKDFLICDGPGSSPTTSVIPGQFNPFTRDKQPKATFGNKELGHTHINWKVTGVMSGAGWDDNVMHAVATIAELSPAPKTVNMLGWSRGAVTCTKLAYKLREIFPDIAVNIFAVDPVAGIGNKSDVDASTIRGNVKNYLAVLSMHETRGFFKPQDAKRVTFTNAATNAVFVPFPGNHSGQVNLDKNVSKNQGEAAQMVWFLAWKFLDHFGTRFISPPSPSYNELEQCNLYAKMKQKMPGYKKTSPGTIASAFMGGGKTRDYLNNRIDQYVKFSDFFISEHHRRIFKRTLPHLYRWVFENQGSDTAAVIQDFKKAEFYPALKQTLVDAGFQQTRLSGVPTVLLPIRGGGQQAVDISAQQLTASMSSMGLYV